MKKILAIVLVLLMALQLAPFAASAEELTHDHDHEEESAEAAVPEEEPAAEEPAPEDGEEIPAEIPEVEPAPTETDLRSLEIPAPEPAAAAEPDAVPAAAEPKAVSAPTGMWLAPSEASGIPSRIDVYVSNTQTSGTSSNRTYTYTAQLYLPGNAVLAECCLSWDGGAQATVDSATVDSGSCPIPAVGATKTYTIKVDRTTYVYKVTAYQGSSGVTPVFIEIDESQGTIANMKKSKDNTCSGIIFIGGQQYGLTKMKGRGNASWDNADDKKPYNLTLDTKIKFPGLDSSKTKKWSFLAEVLDRSLLCNRIGFHMAYEMGIGQDTASADVWMNGEYQGCYTVTPKTDSFVSKTGYMVEQDNYKEPTIANGGDPQFTLEGLKESSGWSSCYNRITVKKMGDDFLGYDETGEPDESVANMEAKAAEIQSWLQDAWDAIRSSDGYNSKGKYYTDYIDIESFAKMYLMHEYDKNYDVCAGSILFYRNGTADTDKLYAGPIWDLDNSMGSCCRNDRLGKADDRSNGDRRSAQGKFIDNITEYKTSIYKTLYTHQDFKDEVQFQYNRYRDQFDALDTDLQQLIDEIADSAAMNYKKVNDIGNGQYQNLHYYSSATTLGSGNYRQSYVATTEWSKYAANLKTYLTYRSKWFRQDSGFYDPDFVDPATCEHQYAEVIDPAPTCTADGLATYTCPICKDSYKVVLPKIPHDYQNGACTVCGEVLVTAAISCSQGASVTVYETQSLESPHVDNAAEAHPRNGDTGLIDCAGDGQINFVVHLQEGFVLDGVSAAPKNYKNLKLPADTGIENGYRLTKVTGDLTITVTAHCEHEYEAAVTAPTCTEEGYTTHTCVHCGDSYTDTPVAPLGHAWGSASYEWAEDNGTVTATRVCSRDASHTETETAKTTSAVTTPATCEAKGKTTYTAVFTNSAFETQTKTLENVEALGHEWGTPSYEWAEDNGSVTAKRVCAHDASHVDKETVNTSSEITKQPTCEEKGETTYTAVFTNSAFAKQTKTVDDINATGHTPGTPVRENEKAPTCTAAGSYDEVTYCTVCHKELKREQKTVPATGHDWDAPTYEWAEDNGSVTATRICQNDPSHPETETVRTTSEITKQPTCEEKGETTYTAVFTNSAFAKQTKTVDDINATGHTPGTPVRENEKAPTCTAAGSYDEVTYCTVCHKELKREQKTVPATGHDWNAPTYEWAEDNGSVTATRICQNDPSHPETETVRTTSEITKQPTCEEKGETTYTAVFTNSAFAKQTKTVDDINATGHTPGTPVRENEKAPTCTVEGSYDEVTYCTVCRKELNRETKTVPATGHEWNAPTYEWAEDNGTATAKRVCAHDASHEEKETVKTTSEVTKEPTCTEPGETTWTAAFTNKAFAGQTKTEANIPALGHEPGDPVTENAVPATEEADGSHDEVVYCARCGAELSRTTVTDKYVKPEFRSQSLVLSGQIGLNFFLELPELEGVDYGESYMEFTVGKDPAVYRDAFDPDDTNSDGTRYGFTCYVNSIQMADTITATFHYGDGKTAVKEYSVAQYIEFFDEHAGDFSEKTIALIHAIADYGHYEQIFLAEVNGWTVGDKYAEMKACYTDPYDYAAILAAVEDKAFVKTLDGSGVTKTSYKLHLDSETTVDVFLTAKSGVTLTASAEFGGKTYEAVKQNDGRYLVRIPGISAHQLGDMITITGNAGGAFTVKVSALSYTRSVLNSGTAGKAAKDGVSALYAYYAAVLAYRA